MYAHFPIHSSSENGCGPFDGSPSTVTQRSKSRPPMVGCCCCQSTSTLSHFTTDREFTDTSRSTLHTSHTFPMESTTSAVPAASAATTTPKQVQRKVIVVLECASLETVKTSKGYQLLNCDDHKGLHRKINQDPSASRPDILHQELMALLDSPLNKAGHLQVFIQSSKSVLIEVSPHMRIPRTYKRFAGLMVQLLHTYKIRSTDSKHTLLKVIKNPVTRHLPANGKKYGCSCTGTLVNPWEFADSLPTTEPLVFVFGAMAHGHVSIENTPYAEEMISLSEYPLSGAQAITRLTNALERTWGIL